MLVSYVFNIEKDGDGYMIKFPDFSEGISYAETEEEIYSQAHDCLETMISYRYLDRMQMPRPSRTGKDDLLVSPTIPTAMKLLVLWGIEDGKVKNQIDLAVKLGIAPTQVNRMLDPHKSTHTKHLDKALEIMGIRPALTVEYCAAKPSVKAGRVSMGGDSAGGENRAGAD